MFGRPLDVCGVPPFSLPVKSRPLGNHDFSAAVGIEPSSTLPLSPVCVAAPSQYAPDTDGTTCESPPAPAAYVPEPLSGCAPGATSSAHM